MHFFIYKWVNIYFKYTNDFEDAFSNSCLFKQSTPTSSSLFEFMEDCAFLGSKSGWNKIWQKGCYACYELGQSLRHKSLAIAAYYFFVM